MAPPGELSKRDIAGLKFTERFPWVLPGVAVAVWPIAAFGAWHKLSALFERGVPHGVGSVSELRTLMDLDAGATYDAFQVLAIATGHDIISELFTAFLISIFALVGHYQTRLSLRLWHLSQRTPSASHHPDRETSKA